MAVKKTPTKKADDRKPWIVDTYKLVAEFHGVSYDHVRRLCRQGMPGKPGHFDLSEQVKYRIPRLIAQSKGVSADDLEENGAERAPQISITEQIKQEKLREQLRQIRRANDEQEKLTYRREDVNRALVAWSIGLREQLNALPNLVSAMVPNQMKATVKRQCADLLQATLKQTFEARVMDIDLDEMILELADEVRSRKIA